jgi:hypothetical protein
MDSPLEQGRSFNEFQRKICGARGDVASLIFKHHRGGDIAGSASGCPTEEMKVVAVATENCTEDEMQVVLGLRLTERRKSIKRFRESLQADEVLGVLHVHIAAWTKEADLALKSALDGILHPPTA